MSLGEVWFALLGLVAFLALALDGFDLGIGILTLFCREERERAAMLNSIGPVWHANLTWLVVLGGLFFGAFPLAYGVVLSASYLPLAAMLLGLIFRGVSFDFREEAQSKLPWNLGFGLGSLTAALAQGFILGSLAVGLRVQGREFAGGVWDWLNPGAALLALGLVAAYLLLGASYLIMKTAGEVQENAYRYARAAAWLLLLSAVEVGLWGIFGRPFLARKWWVYPSLVPAAIPALLAALSFILVLTSLRQPGDRAPFYFSLGLFLFLLLAMAASLYPYVVPPALTVAEAAAPPLILTVMLAVVAPLLPVMLIYNGYQYLVFRGKVGEAGGYGDSE